MSRQNILSQRVRPAAGKHAIEIMALAVEWAKPLDKALIEEAAELVRTKPEVKNIFPTERKFPGFEINVTENGASVVQDQLSIFDFLNLFPNGTTKWSLSLRPEFFSYSCTDYDRWATVKPIATKNLGWLVQWAVDHGSQISAVGLQYSDAFRWDSEDRNVIRELLRGDSPLLPNSIFNRDSLWHSHSGWYSKYEDGHRVLNTVNVDLIKEQRDSLLRINGQHRFQACSFADESPLAINSTDLDSIADHLHKTNKYVLQEILSDSVLNLINMEKAPTT